MKWLQLSSLVFNKNIHIYKTEQGYYYFELPNGIGYKKIWINRKLIKEEKKDNETIYKINTEFTTYRKTEKGNIVILPNENKDHTVVVLQGVCGYRGTSEVSGTFEKIERGAYYHSPRGSLGIDDIVLAKIRHGDIIKLKRSGRLYGEPAEITYKVIFSNDTVKIIVADEDDDEQLKNLL